MLLEVKVFEFLYAFAFTSSGSEQSCHGHAGILLFLWFPIHRMWLPDDVGSGSSNFGGDLMLRDISLGYFAISMSLPFGSVCRRWPNNTMSGEQVMV